MGCGASSARQGASAQKPSLSTNQQAMSQKQTFEASTFMTSLQGHTPNLDTEGDETTKMVHVIELNDGVFSEKMPERIECDAIVEFRVNGNNEYDVLQVYKDGNDYYRVNQGYELLNIKNKTSEQNRRIMLSLALNQNEIELYFCVIPSSERQTILTSRKCPKANCEKNCLKVKKCEIKFSLTDEKETQKIYLHKGDTVELEWTTKRGPGYRIEEKKYCPVSGGLYTVEQTSENGPSRLTSRGKFSKTFDDFGMSFLCRLSETNAIHDVTVCIVNEAYKIKHVEITDTAIQPNIIWIQQADWIAFDWNTKRKQTVVQIEPYGVDEKKQQSIELKTSGEHFFWPNEPTRRGLMNHQFNDTGVYCYKTDNNQIGTIVVEPYRTIYHIPVFTDQLIHKMNTKDLIQFDWKHSDSEEEPILITIDPGSSVVPETAGGVSGIFDCALHKCTKIETFFRHHFYTCETFLLNIPQHGLYNFSYSEDRNNALISVIVENGVDNHRVTYDEQNEFEPKTLVINRGDQVWFDSSTTNIASLHQTDEHGNRVETAPALFQPQPNSINYFMKEFQQLGVYYFSTDITNNNVNSKGQKQKDSAEALAIIVIPEIRFHYKIVRENEFDSHPIVTNVNDFIIWEFERNITRNVIQLHTDSTLTDIVSCHDRALEGRHRRCLGVECTLLGTHFFANPEFERAAGSEQDRLLSTIIVDPPFSQHSFIITNRQFVPNVLYISENGTVSWTLPSNERNHQISVQLAESYDKTKQPPFVERNISEYVHDVHHLHTFTEAGEYIIRSNLFQGTASVFVLTENMIRTQKRQVQNPRIVEEIDMTSEFGKELRLSCPNRNASIYYTLDGSVPTRHFDHVQLYGSNDGVHLLDSGLRVLRAYATEDQKVASAVITSSPTFVMPDKELEAMNELRSAWDSCKITLTASLEQPNKLYANIGIEPTSSTDIIDHLELYINDVALAKNIAPTDLQFSAEGFAGGEQYEICVVAHPKENVLDAEPISSNKRAFEIKREIQGGAPLVTLSVATDQSTLFLTWAHIGDHVGEYVVYVDDIETKIITDRDFNEFYVIQFHGTQLRKRYQLHVEAKIKDSNEIRKSNVVVVTPPLEMPIKGQIRDQYFPFIIINGETMPSDAHTEKGSERLSSPKLPVKNSSSPLPSSSTPPAASSRPSLHVTDMTNATLRTSETISQRNDDHDDKTKNVKKQEPPETNLNDTIATQITLDDNTLKPKARKSKQITDEEEKEQLTQQKQPFVLSDESKARVRLLLEQLTQAIETRSKQSNSSHVHPHASYLGLEHYTDHSLHSQEPSTSSRHPFTDKRPPKSQRPIQLNYFPNRRLETNRKVESLPITSGRRNAVPAISYKRNPNGITLIWAQKSPAVADTVENYQIMVDDKKYGDLINPRDEPRFQINLAPGKHDCYLEVLPKDKNDEIFKSNILRIDIPTSTDPIHVRQQQPPRQEQQQQQPPRQEQQSQQQREQQPQQEEEEPPPQEIKKTPREASSLPIHKFLEQPDLPIPKLNVRPINASSILATWYLDRGMPADAYVAIYEVHVRGQDFPDKMTSDEQTAQDGYKEHIWHVSNSPLEISGISERHEYIIFVQALYHGRGLSDTKYLRTKSNEVTTARVDPLIDLLSRPLLKVNRLGLQTASLSWKLDDSVDEKLVKGYRIIHNSKPTEMLSPEQHDYELRDIKPGTINEIQVAVTSHPEFVDQKVSEPIRIACPKRPQPPVIEYVPAEEPFSIGIKWKLENNEQDEISSFRVFLDEKLHGNIEINGRQLFKYQLSKLQADRTYSIHVKALIAQKRLDGYSYQCDIESKASNELNLKCATPPTGTIPRIERMLSSGVEIVWDAPTEYGDVKLTGYQILKNGRAIGKSVPIDKRRASIMDLEVGNRYSLQVVPITNQPGGTLFRTGEEYDPDRHKHYLPGPKLEIDYTDLVDLPPKFWIESISGHSALVCWSPIDQTASSNIQPDGYKLSIWNDKELTREKAMIVSLSKEKTSAQLTDLQSDTQYQIQLEAQKKRRNSKSGGSYAVVSTSEVLTFQTGSPPDAPSSIYLIACTNTDVRIGFDPFIEHNAEIITLRVLCEPISSHVTTRDITIDLTPDSTEFVLSNLIENVQYNVTIYAVTEEYLTENSLRDVSQLPKKLKPSDWLPNQTLQFTTSGCQPVSQINVLQATTESIQLEWILPKVSGSTQYIGQILRWKREKGGEEQTKELDRNVTSARIPGILLSGTYQISLDSLFSAKVNLDDDSDESDRKELRLTTNVSVVVRFQTPAARERPEIHMIGYSAATIDIAWNKPHLFDVIDHPEKINEQLRIHRRLLGYGVNINGKKHDTLNEDQCRCTLTECQPGKEYKVQLIAKTTVQNGYLKDSITDAKEDTEEPVETPSKELRVRMLKNEDLLRSFQANFDLNHSTVSEENSTREQNNPLTSLGKININWTVSDTKTISHFILQWRSSKDLHTHQKTIASNETSASIDQCDEKQFYVIDLIDVTNDGNRNQHESLTVPIPGEPDAPKVWLVKTTDTSFIIEWSEPKSYGIPVIGFQLFIAGKKAGDVIEVNSRRAEIPSRINRTYQVNVCAVTSNLQRPSSMKSQTLSVITTPTTNLIPTIYYNNDDGGSTSFDRSIARIIPLQIESVNEEKLHLDWTSFLPTAAIRAYYIHYTCLNNGDVQAMKVSKRFRHAILSGLRPGFTYGIMVMAVDKNGGVLYTSDKSTAQMNAPPNAPIVAISERTNAHVKLEWRPAASYGGITVTGYKIFVNNRLAALLAPDQLTYTLTKGTPCDIYTVHVQALSNEKNIVSPMSRGVQFSWPGIKPGAFKRIDDGQTGTIVLAWEHPQLEDEMERLNGFKLFSENITTSNVRLHGEYDAGTHQATIHDLNAGKYRLWLEVQSEHYCTRARPITVMSGRFNSLLNRQSSDSAKCYARKQPRFRSPAPGILTPPLRHIQHS